MYTDNLTFQIINPTENDWLLIEKSPDSSCSKTEGWYRYFLSIGRKPIIVQVCAENGVCIGYFIGEMVCMLVRIIASPFDGTGTYTQGLALLFQATISERLNIYTKLASWFIENKYATMVQFDDWNLKEVHETWIPNNECAYPEFKAANIRYACRPTLFLPIRDKSEEDLWNGLHYKSCKYCVNKARKLGLSIRVINNYEDIDNFVDIHYKQIYDVADRKGMKPRITQSKKRICALCKSLFPDRVLMIEVIGKDDTGLEQIMSTGVFCIDKGECLYTTGASFRQYMKYCPNELMVWEAIRILHERGAGDLNFGGMADYKLKFGTMYAYVPRLLYSKYNWLWTLKDTAKKIYHLRRTWCAKIHGK